MKFPNAWKNNPNDTEIPLRDKEQTKELRVELGWE